MVSVALTVQCLWVQYYWDAYFRNSRSPGFFKNVTELVSSEM